MDAVFVKRLVDIANETKDRLDDTTAPIKKIFTENDIVFGIWNDTAEPYGVDFIILKGFRLLRDCVRDNKDVAASIGVISCIDVNQAVAAKKVFGDHDHDA
jgi:hypothetical protein